jgi:crotonobetainyl-CoA:carnitine CoA-transferase CaiB-like acyl-CoA transferase
MGEPELADDTRFATRDARVAHADELHARISAWTRTLPQADIVAALEAGGVPAGEIRTPAEAVRDPRVLDRGDVVRLRHPDLRDDLQLYGTGVPIHFARAVTSLDRPAPRLGEHTQSVLSELLGYDEAQLQSVRQDGAA